MTAVLQSVAGRGETGGTDPVVTKPSGTASGDLLVAIGAASSGGTLTAPAGWNTHANSLGTNTPLWTKIAGGSEPASYTFVLSGIANGMVSIVRVTGFDPAAPIDVATGIAGTGALVIPTLTPSGADRLLLQTVCKLNVTSFTGPVGAETYDGSVASTNWVIAGGFQVGGATPTGTKTWTPAAGASNGVGYMLAIKPATQNLAASGFDVSVSFGTVGVKQAVTPSGFATAVAFGTPAVIPDQTVTVAGFAPAVSFGTPTLVQDQFLPTTGFDVAVEFGTPVLESSVPATGFDLPVAFGTPTLVQDQFVTPSGFDVPVLFGDPGLKQFVGPDGFDLSAEFGDPTLIKDNTLPVDGFDTPILFGTPTLDAQPTVFGTVFNHETGDPVGAGVTVKLFDDNDLLVGSTVTDAGGGFIFYRPFGDTDLYWTLAEYEISGTQYHGVSDRGCPAV